MTATCYYHSGQPAPLSCIQCGVPICDECRETIQNKTACKRCAPTMRARFAANPGSNAASMATYPGEDLSALNGSAAKQASEGEKVSAAHLTLGLIVGALVGIIGSLIWEKIYFYGHFSLSLIYLAVGYGVALSIVKISGRGGFGIATAAILVTVATLTIGHLVYASDLLGEQAAESGVAKPPMTWDIFSQVIGQMRPMHWICIALGLYGAFKATEQA